MNCYGQVNAFGIEPFLECLLMQPCVDRRDAIAKVNSARHEKRRTHETHIGTEPEWLTERWKERCLDDWQASNNDVRVDGGAVHARAGVRTTVFRRF